MIQSSHKLRTILCKYKTAKFVSGHVYSCLIVRLKYSPTLLFCLVLSTLLQDSKQMRHRWINQGASDDPIMFILNNLISFWVESKNEFNDDSRLYPIRESWFQNITVLDAKVCPWDQSDHDNELARLINHDARLDMNLPTRRISLTPSDSSPHPIADL